MQEEQRGRFDGRSRAGGSTQQLMGQAAAWLRAVVHSSHGRVPLLCCAGAAALLLVASGFSLVGDIAAPGLVVAGLVAGGFLARRNEDAVNAARLESDAAFAHLLRVCADSAQVWLRQIESARTQGNDQVAELARLFSALCARLENVVEANQLGSGSTRDALVAGLRSNSGQLQALVAALRRLQASRQAIVQEIGSHAAQLKDSAADIRQIALNTRIVALNATIEAARAGEAGKPFGVIVNEMRDLAARTAQASEVFSRHTDQLQRMLGGAFQDDGADGDVSIEGAEHSVRHVIAGSQAMLQQLTDAVAAMDGERAQVRDEISRALVALQFQDRTSQILSHVTRSLEEMRRCMAERQWDALDEARWFEAMASDYSTHEEFRNHGRAPGPDGQPDAGITFF